MPSPSERIKIIQVGAGAMGRLWLDVVADSADVELVGLVDLDLAAAQRSAAGAGLPDVALARSLPELLDQMTAVSEVPLQLPLPHDVRALRVASRLQAEPGGTASVAALARDAGASRRTIERLFLQETGLTVADWRRRLRLLHAVRRLAEGEPVTSVSLEIGYSSVSAFIAAFKRAFGETPGRYASSDPAART